jgi:hypothetical protein
MSARITYRIAEDLRRKLAFDLAMQNQKAVVQGGGDAPDGVYLLARALGLTIGMAPSDPIRLAALEQAMGIIKEAIAHGTALARP